MKRFISIIAIMAMALSMLAMTSCAKEEFSGNVESDKSMTINAVKADKGDYFVTGSLVVEEDEQITFNTNLESGAVTVELISSGDDENIEELPELDGEATYTAYLDGTNTESASFGAGTFMIKATVTEKATGTIEIKVEPAN